MPAVLLSDWTEESKMFKSLEDLPPRLADHLSMSSLMDVCHLDEYDLYRATKPEEKDEDEDEED